MFYLIAYDIADPKRLNRVAKIMKDYGNRVQKSVFECNLQKEQIQRLICRIISVMNDVEDSVRIYKICEICKHNIQILGEGEVTDDPDVYIV